MVARRGSRGWIVLTKDQRLAIQTPRDCGLTRQPRASLRTYAGNLRGVDIAAAFLAALPDMLRIVRSRSGPFVAKVSRAGHVALGQ